MIYGAIVSGVPTKEFRNSFSPCNLANPKSANLIWKSSDKSMLESFRSLWTILCLLITRKASLSCTTTVFTLS